MINTKIPAPISKQPRPSKNLYKVETAELQLLPVMKKIGPDGYAICGNCGVHLVNVEERIKCKYCWNCGRPVKWK